MAGLLAAPVLADFYARVTVVERDTLDDTAASLRGKRFGVSHKICRFCSES